MRAKYGLTWWGEQWLNALTKIDYDNRIPRGHAYASNGSVRSIDIKKNCISAKVQGRRRSPYKILIDVPEFTKSEKKILTEYIIANPLILSKLLNRELPSELQNIASSHNIEIFPQSWRDLGMHCSCPDWAVPCKHLAAVIYIVANEIDKNPFIVLQLHTYDVLKELEERNVLSEMHAKENILSPDDFIQQEPAQAQHSFDENLLLNLDLSTMENIRENLIALLTPSPLFFEKDFRDVLDRSYKIIAKEVQAFSLDPTDHNTISTDDEPCIVVDRRLYFSAFYHYEDKNVQPVISKISDVIQCLNAIEDKHLINYNSRTIWLNTVYHFCLRLLECSAFIPQLLDVKKNEYRVRWIPAAMNLKVNELFNTLLSVFPGDIVVVRSSSSGAARKKRGRPASLKREESYAHLSSREQLHTLCSLFLSYFISQIARSKIFDRYEFSSTKILPLFFGDVSMEFSEFTDQQIPNTIQLWLNRLFITHKNFVPQLSVDDQESIFYIDVLVDETKESLKAPVPLKKFLSRKGNEAHRMEVLKDLTMLSEYFPELADTIQSYGKKRLKFKPARFIDVLLRIIPVLQLFGISILLPKSLKTLIRPKLSLQMKKRVGQEKFRSFLDLDTMLAFDWQVALGDELIKPDEFRKLVQGVSGLVKIKDQYIIVNHDELNALFKNLNQPPQLTAAEKLKVALAQEYEGSSIGLTEEAAQLITNIIESAPVALPDNLNAVLRPYQITGYRWMVKNAQLNFGSLIADDMGLGKTIQVIATLLRFKQEGCFQKNKALAVVPTTLITNWQIEIERFAPDLNVAVYHGPKRKLPEDDFDLLITTYGVVRSDVEKIGKEKWHTLVIDEAQNIKNVGSDQTKAVKQLKADVRIAMSGTPVENRLSEYWSIFDFVNKGYLGNLTRFTEEFAKPIQLYRDASRIDVFRKITAPFILRRLKTDKKIINDLPDKIENNHYCSLTKEQAALYENVVKNTLSQIEKSEGIERKGLVLKLMTALKQVCNHPHQYLKNGATIPELSGKAALLLQLLETMYDNNEKLLIFTQYKEMGDLLVKMIEQQFDQRPLFLHGGVPRKQRDVMVSDFQTRKNVSTFILSLKAGGTGLNLTAASNVIHYDLWWNPAVEAQATDRAYRIGQEKNVMVYRLLTQGTLEEKIDVMITQKKDLANLTVATGETWIGNLGNEQLRELVRLNVPT